MPKLRAGDSSPGVADVIDGDRFHLFGAHEDDYLHGPPGTMLGQRHGAVCRATGDGAIWIERVKPAEPATLKLPAARVLGADHRRLPEVGLSPDDCASGRTWRDIRYQERNHVGYLHFDFYNGAMSTSQCRRFQPGLPSGPGTPHQSHRVDGRPGSVVQRYRPGCCRSCSRPGPRVLARHQCHRRSDPGHHHYRLPPDLRRWAGNAGAGGVILALAADVVYARHGVVLNPRYQTMHLYGSEYWTYLLPRRVGDRQARTLTEACQPISTHTGQSIGLLDDVLPAPLSLFHHSVQARLRR